MKCIAREVLRIAVEMLPQITLVFDKTEAKESDLLSVQIEIQRFVSTIRKNESLESVVSRKDSGNHMILSIGFTEHEARNAIVREIRKLSEKVSKKLDVKLISVSPS